SNLTDQRHAPRPLRVLAAIAAGVTRIFVSEPNANRRERIAALSNDVTILDPGSSEFLSTIKEGTEEGVGVDAAIE
ncbi:hypothetical protein ACC772_40165, partial [Rhizobium ruizarguesonis]